MEFEQIKAVTEKYGPVIEQLDRLQAGKQYHAQYLFFLEKMKLAVADQFVSEIKELQGHLSDEHNPPIGRHE
jgi:hypothetical protein